MSGQDSTWKYYRYDPSLPAAIVFIVLFASSTFLHTYQALRTRTWSFIPFIIGGFFEWIGYIGRVLGHYETPNWALGPYVLQSLLLLVAPALFAASIYMILGRIILLTNHPEFAIVKPLWLTRIFVLGDVLSFLIQAAGAGLMVTGGVSGLRLGEDVVTGGLFVQIVFFGMFISTAIVFNWRMRNTRTQPKIQWQKHFIIIIIASLLIMARSAFRVVEYIQGNAGYLLRHEVFLYVFDGTLMLMQMVLFNAYHPSKLLSTNRPVQSSNPLEFQRWEMT